jgi:hypothetical protein
MPPRTPQPGSSLADRYPEVAAQWHPTKNGDLKPDQVRPGSGLRVWWQCDRGPDHEWRAIVGSRTGLAAGCPMCDRKRPSVTNSLASLYPEIAAQWHPTKNGDLTPDQVIAGSVALAWWKCDKGPDHEWRASPGNRTGRLTRTGCPMCRGLQASITNSLASLFPEAAAQWHPLLNGDLTPNDVVAGSKRKAWWKCPKGPDHEWQAVISSRTYARHGCPMCSGNVLSVTNSLAARYPEIAAQWHPTKNGDLKPDRVLWGSGRSYWWLCDRGAGHEWRASPNRRTEPRQRTASRGCPFCTVYPRSIVEIVVACELATVLPFDVRRHSLVAASRRLDCDMVIPRRHLIIEYDGHWWHRGKSRADRAKTRWLNDAGWTVIRIREKPLRRLGPSDVVVAPRTPQKAIVDALVERLVTLGYIDGADGQAYIDAPDLRARARSDRIIKAIQTANRRAFVPPRWQARLDAASPSEPST